MSPVLSVYGQFNLVWLIPFTKVKCVCFRMEWLERRASVKRRRLEGELRDEELKGRLIGCLHIHMTILMPKGTWSDFPLNFKERELERYVSFFFFSDRENERNLSVVKKMNALHRYSTILPFLHLLYSQKLFYLIVLLYFIVMCIPFAQEEEDHADVDSELDDSGSEIDEEQVTEPQLELRGKVMEKECSTCKGNVTPPLVSGNKGNQQPSACSAEEVLYMSHFRASQSRIMKLSKQTLSEANFKENSTYRVVQQVFIKLATFNFSSSGSRMGREQCICCQCS